MAEIALSYGQSLPDSETLVNSNTEALIALLPSFSSFLTQRAHLSREYAKSLSSLTGKLRLSTAHSAAERFGRDATLELGYARVLEQTDLDAREHDQFAQQLENLVANPLMQAGTRLEVVRKKVSSTTAQPRAVDGAAGAELHAHAMIHDSITLMLDDCFRNGTRPTRSGTARGSATLTRANRWSSLGRRRDRPRMISRVSSFLRPITRDKN